MATFSLPVRQDLAHYEFEVDLDGLTFRIRLKFNSRDDAWYMTILSANGEILRAGIKIINDWILLRLWQDFIVRPEGEIVPIGIGENATTKPGVEDLGADTLLLYEGDS